MSKAQGNNLLFMPLKVPTRFDLLHPLANWLDGEETTVGFSGTADDYEDAAVEWVVPKPNMNSVECRSEFLRLSALRNSLSEHLQDAHKNALEARCLPDCQDYHATLLKFEQLGFPTRGDSSNGIFLTWKGAFDGKQIETHYSLVWDRACTLWNIAALLSFQAVALEEWSTKEICKASVPKLQSAASLLAILRELVESNDYSTVDLSKPMLDFWEIILLAQAQYGIYKLANLGTVRQHTTLAYLVQAAAGMYNEALTYAKDPRLQSELTDQAQRWATHCKAQSLLCQAKASFHLSISHRLGKEHGQELARLSQCVEQLKECHEFYKEAQLEMKAVNSLVQLSTDRIARARQDNDMIYHEDVPKPTELAEIRSQSMVQRNLPLPEELLQPKAKLFEWYDPQRR